MSETAAVAESNNGTDVPHGLRACVVILNAGAGTMRGSESEHGDLAEVFRRHGLAARIELCAEGSAISEHVRRALADGVELVVAGGGDGTINAVASHLVETGATLGVLPLGTLNHFAKDLGIPLERDAAVEVIARGQVIAVDVGEVNGKIFLNNSSLGLYPLAVRLRTQEQKRGTGKWLAFAKASVEVLGRFPMLRVHLDIDGKQIVRRTPIVFIGNNHYELAGLEMTKRSRLDQGVLSVCVTREVGRLGLFALVLRALFGRLRDAKDFAILEGGAVCIETRHAQLRVATDGEVTMMRSPLNYRSRSAALNVIVPLKSTSNDSQEA